MKKLLKVMKQHRLTNKFCTAENPRVESLQSVIEKGFNEEAKNQRSIVFSRLTTHVSHLVGDNSSLSITSSIFGKTTGLSTGLTSSEYAGKTSITAGGDKQQIGSEHQRGLSVGGLVWWQNIHGDAADRFIPKRRGVNLDLSRYLHVNDEDDEKDGVHLNVLKDAKSAVNRWRKKYMSNTFRALNVFGGLLNKRVLNISESSSSSSMNPKLQEFGESQWECHPRQQPLMNLKNEKSKRYRDHGAQIFRFVSPIRLKNLIDWNSKGELAAGLEKTLCICEVDFKTEYQINKIDHDHYLCCVKWSDNGNYVASCCYDGSVHLYMIPERKKYWHRHCGCHTRQIDCDVDHILFTDKDTRIVTSCTRGRINIISTITGFVRVTRDFATTILKIDVSPKEQYLAMSTADRLVKLFRFPSLAVMFEIQFFANVEAFAWHPWSSGILCIGGGPGDASLSLWNVNSQRQLGYRMVELCGSIDHMMFNKLSGELLVHWYYLENNKLRSLIAVLASLDHIVDVVPVQPEHRMRNIVWSHDHMRLAMQHRDTLVIWNFFGADFKKWTETKKKKYAEQDSANKLRNYSLDCVSTTGPYTSAESARLSKSFQYYTIR
ncbi:protein cortex-like [Phymastichus coffea]|uniref:protein cortex-like n=1 Tax=Phymastichus coffea TaxID=108790 RepID=UPI00273CE7ED|nr:protein cortex-like [Phymastichus coffea]